MFCLKSLAASRAPLTSASTKSWSLHLMPMIIAAAMGIALSIVAGFLVSKWENRHAELEFNAVAENHYLVLQHGLNEYLAKLLTLRALFDSSDNQVTRNEFEAFARPHLQSGSAIQTLSWVPVVRRDERATYELAAARDGLKGYQIKVATADGGMVPSREHEVYYPIFYSTVPKTSRLYGLDLRSEPQTLAELERARDDDELGFSTVPALVSAGGKQHGYIFSLPVYRQGSPGNTVESRRRDLIGFVHGSFITARMIDAVLIATTVPRGLDLFFFAPESEPNKLPLHVYGSRMRDAPAEPKQLAALGAGLHWSRDLMAGKRPWMTLTAVPVPGGQLTTSHDRAWIIMAAGLLISGIVVAYLWASGRFARRFEVLALTDSLTTLANRRAFLERIAMMFAASRRGDAPFTVLFLDLDDFKDVNDTLGHAIGDALLQQVVERLKKTVRPTDLIARFGGDEFAILQTDASDPIAAATLAVRIGTCLAETFMIEGHEVRVTASIGISPYAADVAGPEAMMMQADLALYCAKDDGRNCFRFHTGELDQQVHLRVTLAEELRVAVGGRAELELFYQPLVEIISGRIIGLEALVRWNHPTRGLIMPSIFIPIAERTGAIVPLGQWVFEEACCQLKEWHDAGIAPQTLALNVSGVQFKRAADLEVDIAASLAKWGIQSETLKSS